MQLEEFLQFIILYNAQVIEGLVGLIVVLVILVAYRTFVVAKDAELHPGPVGIPNLGDLETALQKILEKANGLPSAASVESSEGGSSDVAPLLHEIEGLKRKLEDKQSEMDEMKMAAPASALAVVSDGAGLNSDDRSKLDLQIKELQAKLSEYEIISEDIADLSFYKEENVRLQKEVTALTESNAESKAEAAPAPSSAAAPAEIVVAAKPTPVVAAAVSAAEVKEPEIVGRSRVPPEVQPIAAETLIEEAASSATNAEADDDLMKEFAAAVAEQNGDAITDPSAEVPAAAELDLGQLDMDRMVAEAATLEAAKVDGPENALEGTLDPKKLLEEAASMEAPEGASVAEDAKLMGDFENFVKKGT